jgi:hypothetical protein
VYRTQVVQQVEAMPLYPLTSSAFARAGALGPAGQVRRPHRVWARPWASSSHSHFQLTPFRQAYGRTPAEFQRSERGCAESYARWRHARNECAAIR